MTIGDNLLTVIAGPCALETKSHSLRLGREIRDIVAGLGLNYIFKGSYDKDGRSSPDSFHGVGLSQGLDILGEVKDELRVPVTTDFSNSNDGEHLAHCVDLIQVPAYLCRQTNVLRAAAQTGLPVHLKKGQFMSPSNLRNSALKLKRFGARSLILTDRGTFLGYDDLVNDFRSQLIMDAIGVPGYDATHSIQRPTTIGQISTGDRRFIPALTRAAIAAGAKVIFLEVHDDPSRALGDPGTVLDVRHLENVLKQAAKLHETMLELAVSSDLNPDIK